MDEKFRPGEDRDCIVARQPGVGSAVRQWDSHMVEKKGGGQVIRLKGLEEVKAL
jgi:hypothetical protein